MQSILSEGVIGKLPVSSFALVCFVPKSFDEDRIKLSQRRVFQALRIAVNDEFKVLDGWLRGLPDCLSSGGRVAVLTFHSGKDRRVNKAFQWGLADELLPCDQ